MRRAGFTLVQRVLHVPEAESSCGSLIFTQLERRTLATIIPFDQRAIHRTAAIVKYCGVQDGREETMERGQGKALSPAKIAKIKTLLTSIDMSMSEIAERMGCSRSRVVAVNEKFKIRLYRNKRSSWVVNRASR